MHVVPRQSVARLGDKASKFEFDTAARGRALPPQHGLSLPMSDLHLGVGIVGRPAPTQRRRGSAPAHGMRPTGQSRPQPRGRSSSSASGHGLPPELSVDTNPRHRQRPGTAPSSKTRTPSATMAAVMSPIAGFSGRFAAEPSPMLHTPAGGGATPSSSPASRRPTTAPSRRARQPARATGGGRHTKRPNARTSSSSAPPPRVARIHSPSARGGRSSATGIGFGMQLSASSQHGHVQQHIDLSDPLARISAVQADLAKTSPAHGAGPRLARSSSPTMRGSKLVYSPRTGHGRPAGLSSFAANPDHTVRLQVENRATMCLLSVCSLPPWLLPTGSAY